VVDTSADVASATRHLAQSAAGALAEVVADAARNLLPSSNNARTRGETGVEESRDTEGSRQSPGTADHR
jgi:hypothetical protein